MVGFQGSILLSNSFVKQNIKKKNDKLFEEENKILNQNNKIIFEYVLKYQ